MQTTETPQATVRFLDVGQGDCTLITQDDTAVLIDGSTPDQGDSIVRELNELGIDELDAVVGTHPHSDHIGGLVTVLNEIPVKACYLSDEVTTTRIYEKLLDAVDEHNIAPEFPEIGDVIQLDDFSLTCLAPGEKASKTYGKDPNAWSLVMRADVAGCRILLTGDTTASVERDMVARDAAALDCDILKVAHHGSRTGSSEKFLAAASPDYAVISVAEHNSYGLPDEEIFERLDALHTVVLSTAEDGEVVFTLHDGAITRAAA